MSIMEKNKKDVFDIKNPANKQQLAAVIGGCKVKVNFAPEPDIGVIDDVKSMIISGLTKP